jgi:hypothetical protein
MPAASTLSLGQGTFILGPDTTQFGTPPSEISVVGSTSALISKTTPGLIDGLTLDTALSPSVSTNSATFLSGVTNLDANLGDGGDTITFTASVSNSTIFTDSTATSAGGAGDRFVAAGSVTSSTINTGAGNDTLVFTSSVSGVSIETGAGSDNVTLMKEVIDSSIQTGGGGDNVVVQSLVSDSSFELGGGNDTLTFGGTLVGFGANSSIDLGGGADTLIFGASSFVLGYSIDLGGADGAIDQVQYAGALTEGNLTQITGGSSGDILVIGAGVYAGNYTYAEGFGFVDGSDTLTWLS